LKAPGSIMVGYSGEPLRRANLDFKLDCCSPPFAAGYRSTGATGTSDGESPSHALHQGLVGVLVQHSIEENLSVSVLQIGLLKSVLYRPHIPRASQGTWETLGICGFEGL
jgi:hypothetical protein